MSDGEPDERQRSAVASSAIDKGCTQKNNPLHGITLARMLEELVESHGWAGLGKQVEIRCFTHDPSIKSSLQFLRRTPWAREKVELLYLKLLNRKDRNGESTQSKA